MATCHGGVLVAKALAVIGSSIVLESGSVTRDAIERNGERIKLASLQVLHRASTNFDTAIGGTPAGRESVLYIASTTGVIRGFYALLTDTGTSTDIDFDLKKNGTTVLSAAVNITNADSDGTVKSGTISDSTIAADDYISIAMTVTSSTGAQGPYAWAEIQETARA